jgi:DNA-binding CsgD family transcriptional regulator
MLNRIIPEISPKALGLQAIVEQIECATTLDDVHRAGLNICECFDFPKILFTMYYATSLFQPLSVLICNHPNWWSEAYMTRYRRVDPVAQHCRTRSTPIIIGQPNATIGVDDENLKAFVREATKAGLASGVAVPIHGLSSEWGMLILSSDESPESIREKVIRTTPYVAFLATHLQEAVRRIVIGRDAILPNFRLTKREKECLLWSAEGKTSWETARILNISERTVIYHVQNVITKLNVSNRTQAVGRAAAMLLADPDLPMAQLGSEAVFPPLLLTVSGGRST